MAGSDLLKQLQGSALTTAEIHYLLPDYPSLLQLFIWQDYDEAPDFPALHLFLGHWHREIEGICIRSGSPIAAMSGRLAGGSSTRSGQSSFHILQMRER